MSEPLENQPESTPDAPVRKVRLRSVAIPAEHGGWGMLFEPILLGLLVVPSVAGLFLALAVAAAFLARTPLKIIWKDARRGRRYARTSAAVQVLALDTLFIIAGVLGAFYFGGFLPLLPLILIIPLVLLQVYFDLFSSSRKLLPELIAPVMLSSVVAGMALAYGWDPVQAIALWSVPLFRSIPTVFYVRTRIRLDRRRPAAVRGAVIAHILAVVIAATLAAVALLPWLAVIAYLILLGRAVYGLSPYRKPISVKRIGWSEIAFGVLTVLLAAIGYRI